jgi:rubrerythrin
MFTIRDIVDIAIRIEKNGEKVYRTAQSQVQSSSLGALLGWLADQEREHVSWFSDMRDVLPGEVDDDSPLAQMGREMLDNVVGEHAFSLEDADFSAISTIDELIDMAIELETDTVLFYEMLADFVQEEESRQHLKEIIREELKHAELLKEFRTTGHASLHQHG